MPYGCHNHETKSAYMAQDGYKRVTCAISEFMDVEFSVPNFKDQFHTMSRECKYDKNQTDKGCDGCKHK